MCCGERLGHLDGELQCVNDRERAALKARGERFALGEFHHQELDAFVLSHVVKRADVGMIERRGGLGLTLESPAAVLTRRAARGQPFERDDTLEPRVSRSVDLPHAADADEREDLVRAEASAGCERGRTVVGSKRVQRAFQNLWIEWSRKLSGPIVRFEVGPDVLHANAFGSAGLLQRVWPYAQVELAYAIEDCTDASPGVCVEPAAITSL
jgi:hypothetical protein